MTPRSRARFLPAVAALPAVAVLWLTIGLPMLSQLTSAGGSNRLGRSVVFGAQGSDPGGGPASGASAPETVATAIVSNEVLAAYHAEVARRAQARARTATRPKRLRPILPQPALTSAAPDTATLATADAPQDPSQRADATPPANDKGPGAGNSGGSLS